MLRHYARYFSYLFGGASRSPALRLDQEWWDEDYRRGGLERTEGSAEVARYLLVAGLVRHYAPGGAVLDVGCGTGGLIAPLRANFAGLPSRYVGLDYADAALETAAARGQGADQAQPPLGSIEFVRSDFDEYQPVGLFDAIIFSESLYYAPNALRTVRHYAASLSEGGILVVSMWRRPSRRHVWRTLAGELREVSRTRIVVPRRPAWDIVVYARGSTP